MRASFDFFDDSLAVALKAAGIPIDLEVIYPPESEEADALGLLSHHAERAISRGARWLEIELSLRERWPSIQSAARLNSAIRAEQNQRDSIRQRQRQQELQREAALEAATEKLLATIRWPELSGSARQIALAEQIRQPLRSRILYEYALLQATPDTIKRTRQLQMIVALVRESSAARWAAMVPEYRAHEAITSTRRNPNDRSQYLSDHASLATAAHGGTPRTPDLLGTALNAAADWLRFSLEQRRGQA